jgi:hypothetical protein
MLNISSWKDSFNPNEYEYTENYSNNKPDYICIGVMKGGTTSLIHYLNYHPDIFMADPEVHFFDKTKIDGSSRSRKEIINYENRFSETNKPIKGEKTPSYCYLKYAMDNIYNYDKNMKLIILLREPISRAYANYNHGSQVGNTWTLSSKTDKQMLDDFKTDKIKGFKGGTFILKGYYDEILDYILSKFPRQNLYIGISEEINENKLKYYNEIYEFLGASRLDKINENLNTHIRQYDKPIPKSLEKYLYNIYKPHNERLYKILGRRIEKWEEYYKQI